MVSRICFVTLDKAFEEKGCEVNTTCTGLKLRVEDFITIANCKGVIQ